MWANGIALRARALASRDRRLLANVAGVGGLKLVATGLAMLATVVLARLLGPNDFGSYTFAFSMASILTLPMLQGLPTLVVREVARSTGETRRRLTRVLLRFSNKVVLAVGVLLGLGGVGLVVLRNAQGETIDPMLVFAALTLPLAIVAGLVRSAVTRAYGFAVRGQLPDLIARPLLFLGLLAILWLLPERSAGLAMTLHMVAALTALLVAAMLMPKAPVGDVSADFSTSAPAWLKALFPLSTIAGMQLVISQIETIALGVFATDADVGIYRIATALALQVSFVLTVVNLVAAPRFASLYHEGRLTELKRLNRTAALTSSLIGAFVVVVYAIYGKPLIELTVGREFLSALTPLMILSGAHLATLWAGTTNVLLNMIGRERDVLVAAVVALTASATMNIVLVPPFGTTGAACAGALGLFTWRGMLSWFMARHFVKTTLSSAT